MNKQLHYFERLTQALHNYGRAIPCLILDLDLLDQNIQVLKQFIRPGKDFRIVVKSLPSPDLIQYVMDQTGTRKLMVFHQPFLSDLSTRMDHTVDILLGKPMPVKTAAYYYQNLQTPNGFNPSRQLQWLVDTEKRLAEYLDLAKALDRRIRLNLEIDVGLHRGGFDDLKPLARALQVIRDHSGQLEFSGLMGYDPHVVKLPKMLRSPQKAFRLANDFYASCIQLIREQFPDLWNEELIFNGAGSPSIPMHADQDSVLNELSAGSCLVKPTTFDIPTLAAFQPACFIAAPVLKKMQRTRLPGLEKFTSLLSWFSPAYRNAYFIYGGYWKADYVYPGGTKENALFGPSTNQSMINMPTDPGLEVDDFVFLRPSQSEFVFLQFGEMLVLRNGEIAGVWSLLKNS